MKGMIYKVPIKHKEETPTQALAKDIQNNLSVIKDDIVASSQENVINGESLDDFIYHHFLNRIDPVEYCENVLRHHLPESRQKLHENQTALIRAVWSAGNQGKYAVGDGATTFRLPDYRGLVS